MEGVVKSDDVMSQILSGKIQPTDTVENVMVKGFKVVSVYTGMILENKCRRQITVVWKYFVSKKFSWTTKSTKKITRKILNTRIITTKFIYVTAIQYLNTIYINFKTTASG